MKFLTAVVPLLCATFTTARALVDSTQQISINPSFPVPGDSPLTYCANPKFYPGKLDYINLSPNPPVPGEKLKISVSGILDQEIGKGTKVQLRVKWGPYITLINQTYDLCDNLPKIGEECPLKKGPLTIEREADIPSVVPPGTYTVYANVIGEDQSVVVCMEAEITF